MAIFHSLENQRSTSTLQGDCIQARESASSFQLHLRSPSWILLSNWRALIDQRQEWSVTVNGGKP